MNFHTILLSSIYLRDINCGHRTFIPLNCFSDPHREIPISDKITEVVSNQGKCKMKCKGKKKVYYIEVSFVISWFRHHFSKKEQYVSLFLSLFPFDCWGFFLLFLFFQDSIPLCSSCCPGTSAVVYVCI